MVQHAAHVEGNPKNLNFMIEISSAVIDPKLTSFAYERSFVSKDKLHLSVISFANQKKLNDLGDPDIFSKIKQLADQYQWHYSLEPEYFIVEKFYDRTELEKSGYGPDVPEHLRKTIIQQAHILEIVDFYHKPILIVIAKEIFLLSNIGKVQKLTRIKHLDYHEFYGTIF